MLLELEDNLKSLNLLMQKLNNLEDALAISSLEKELEELKSKTLENGFWDNQESSAKIFAKIKKIERKLNSFNGIKNQLQALIEMNELIIIEYDEDLAKDIIAQTTDISKKIEQLELETLLADKYDYNNAIITLHPGAGGTESQDWVQMLYRMYRKMG